MLHRQAPSTGGRSAQSQLLVYMAVMAAALFEGLPGTSLGHMLCDADLQTACPPTYSGGIMPQPVSSMRPAHLPACCDFCCLAWTLPESPWSSAAGLLLSGRRQQHSEGHIWPQLPRQPPGVCQTAVCALLECHRQQCDHPICDSAYHRQLPSCPGEA